MDFGFGILKFILTKILFTLSETVIGLKTGSLPMLEGSLSHLINLLSDLIFMQRMHKYSSILNVPFIYGKL